MRCVEWFSGIGGLHCALTDACVRAPGRGVGIPAVEVVAAYDVNDVANRVYRHNFGLKPCTRSIDHLSVEDVAKLRAEIWLMSPPCQPFTRGGRQADADDPRSSALLHLITVLESLPDPPQFILLENVKNFEVSETRRRFIKVLRTRGYTVEEFLLSPHEFGIPYERWRYFCLARLPGIPPVQTVGEEAVLEPLTTSPLYGSAVTPVGEFTVGEGDEDVRSGGEELLLLDDAVVEKSKGFRFDVATCSSSIISCFTKSYGARHYVRGSGAVYAGADRGTLTCTERFTELPVGARVRYFTPLEILRFHSFPPTFTFPPETTTKQRYNVLGNSLNVLVVRELLIHLLTPPVGGVPDEGAGDESGAAVGEGSSKKRKMTPSD